MHRECLPKELLGRIQDFGRFLFGASSVMASARLLGVAVANLVLTLRESCLNWLDWERSFAVYVLSTG